MRAAFLVIAIALTTSATAADKPKPAPSDDKADVVMPASDLKWVDGPNGRKFAAVRGDASKGAFARFVKFPGGTDNPLHTHSATLRFVVLSGTFYHGADAASAVDLGPGSYSSTPGGMKHVSGCRAGAECVIYQEATGKFDQKLVGGK